LSERRVSARTNFPSTKKNDGGLTNNQSSRAKNQRQKLGWG
jgi:hypothetical protein